MLNIKSVPIASLTPDPANARKHSAKNLDAIKGSLAKFGQQKPIVVDKNNVVIAGNGTLEAAKALGLTDIDVVQTELTGPEAIAFALADNKTSELAEWDQLALDAQLKSLMDVGIDIADFGFNPPSIDILGEITGAQELNPDDFQAFENKCPKCGFEFDNKPA